MTSSRAQTPARGQGGGGQGSNSMLLELVDRILDKGIVIDAWARVSVLSIELLTIEARVVVASVDTYLRYAEAIGNTALASMPHPQPAQQPLAAQGGGRPLQQGQLGGQQLQGLPAPQQQNMMPQRQGQQQQMQPQPAVQPPQQAQQAQQAPQQIPPQQQQQSSPQPSH